MVKNLNAKSETNKPVFPLSTLTDSSQEEWKHQVKEPFDASQKSAVGRPSQEDPKAM
jgi:hypothetical protein